MQAEGRVRNKRDLIVLACPSLNASRREQTWEERVAVVGRNPASSRVHDDCSRQATATDPVNISLLEKTGCAPGRPRLLEEETYVRSAGRGLDLSEHKS